MDYLEFSFTVTPPIPGTDLLISELSEIGFESFEELSHGCKAWISADDYDESLFENMAITKNQEFEIDFHVKMILSKNWNSEWEKDFEPVIVGDCIIRAPFHVPEKKFSREVIILPQMSFGTGHHETTWLMAGKLLTLDLKEKKILDMGCGTGILAILAAQSGAAEVCAIDTNADAVENTRSNMLLNQTENMVVHKGDATLLQGKLFHVIFANINRNVLLEDIKHYAGSLFPGGHLVVSGFFETDNRQIVSCASENNLKIVSRAMKNEWALLEFVL